MCRLVRDPPAEADLPVGEKIVRARCETSAAMIRAIHGTSDRSSGLFPFGEAFTF